MFVKSTSLLHNHYKYTTYNHGLVNNLSTITTAMHFVRRVAGLIPRRRSKSCIFHNCSRFGLKVQDSDTRKFPLSYQTSISVRSYILLQTFKTTVRFGSSHQLWVGIRYSQLCEHYRINTVTILNKNIQNVSGDYIDIREEMCHELFPFVFTANLKILLAKIRSVP